MILVIILVSCLLNLVVATKILADSPQPKSIDSFYQGLSESAEKGVRGPIGDWHYYLKDGFRIDSPIEKFTFKTNVSIMFDGGHIGADDEFERAFPDLEGYLSGFADCRCLFSGPYMIGRKSN